MKNVFLGIGAGFFVYGLQETIPVIISNFKFRFIFGIIFLILGVFLMIASKFGDSKK